MKKYILLAVLLGGCASAPLTEEEQYERADKLAQYQDKYYGTVEWCMANSHVMWRDWTCKGGRRNEWCPPKRLTDRFQCVRLP
ncbi:MAG: hypothetical protein ACYSW3_25300 [Planctomycetota bacterium]|jgi:hypothetical protein